MGHFLNPTDFEDKEEDDVMECHLFDVDFEEDVVDNSTVDMMPSTLALVELAICTIENIDEDRGVYVMPGVMGLLMKDCIDDPIIALLRFGECDASLHYAKRDRRGARHRPKPPHSHSHDL